MKKKGNGVAGSGTARNGIGCDCTTQQRQADRQTDRDSSAHLTLSVVQLSSAITWRATPCSSPTPHSAYAIPTVEKEYGHENVQKLN
jgi:hypothetical protein